MSEKRNVDEILNELFKGRDAALEKYAKVRHTQYELMLWTSYGVPIKEIDRQAKVYFEKRFLNGTKMDKLSKEQVKSELETLDHAVKDGCHGRCTRLVKELNAALEALGLDSVKEIDRFLDWLTFDYVVKSDYEGKPLTEPGYGFQIRVFHDGQNRKEFWAELQLLLKSGKMMSMQDACRIVLKKRKKSKSFSKTKAPA